MYDIIIIGAGPAGISAALYARRENLSVLVLHHGASQLEKAHSIENYYGFPHGISGQELYETGIAQARALGIQVTDAEVTDIQPATESSYSVTASSGSYEAAALIIATGNKKLRPAIEGLSELEGKGVSYCAVCDGFFYRGKRTCVIGSQRYALEEALHLANIAAAVTILTNGENASGLEALLAQEQQRNPAAQKITVEKRKIAAVQGGTSVEGVRFTDGGTLESNGVFVALGSAGGADFAKKLGLKLAGDSIDAGADMATNAPGIYACGNVTGGLLQISKAVYEGAVAGLSAARYVRSRTGATDGK